MKKSLLLLFPLIFISCASFNPGNVDYRSALTSPRSKSNDSVFVFVKQYSVQEAKLIFDTDFRYEDFEPIYVSIFNRSNYNILVVPQSFIGFTDLVQVYKETKSSPFSYFLIWSTPWVINIVAGWPIYYGIAWPIFGGIAMGKTSGANTKREEFYKSVALKETEILNGQEVYGIVFIKKTKEENIVIQLQRNGSPIEFYFKNNTEMFFK